MATAAATAQAAAAAASAASPSIALLTTPTPTPTPPAQAAPVDKIAENVALQVADAQSLLLLLKTPDTALCCSVLEALVKYGAESKTHRQYLVSQGIVPELIALLRGRGTESTALKKHITACLSCVTDIEQVTPDMAAADTVMALLQLIQSEEAVEILDEACATLSHIAREYSVKNAVRKQSGIKQLASLMASADPDVRRSATATIHVLLEDYACRTAIRTLGAIPSLVDGCASEYPEIQDLALAALARCAQDSAARLEMRKLAVHKRLVELLALPSHANAAHAVLAALSACLEDKPMNAGMRETPAAEHVAKLLVKEDLKVKRAATDFLAVLGREPENQAAIRDSGCLSGLFSALSHPDPSIVSAAALALHVILPHDSNEPEVLKSPVFDVLLQRLNDADVRDAILLALANCFTIAKLRLRVRTHPALGDLVRFAGALDDPAPAALCIGNASDDDPCRQELVRLDAVAVLVSVVEAKSAAGVKVDEVLAALARLLQEPAARAAFRTANGVAVTMALLDNAPKLAPASVHAVCSVVSMASSQDDIAADFCQSGATARLLPLMDAVPLARTALDKLLDHHLSARYWLHARLDAHHSTARADFYDTGAAYRPSSSSGTGPSFPSLDTLRASPLDTRAAVVWIAPDEQAVREICDEVRRAAGVPLPPAAVAGDAPSAEPAPAAVPAQYVPALLSAAATAIARRLGALTSAATAEAAFRLAELKCAAGSNVLPATTALPAMTAPGHRALLLKAVCDRLGVGVALVRGEYGRCWNEATVRAGYVAAEMVDGDGAAVVAALDDGSVGGGEEVAVILDLEAEAGVTARLLVVGTPAAGRYVRL
ncbi:hypothetical protein H9P43_003624 [Blastocladiella emersonii ATCC 22665]|nr:hypothetical protein H9P43_003624 [Blastocladiella emersonii ATCC 22665]